MNAAATLLIVDDEDDLLDILAQDLSSLADRVLTATNGEEALALIEREQVDAILSDIHMPRMSGLALLKEIRRRGMTTPLIFLTAFGDFEKSALAHKLGAFEFLEKPFDRAKLKQTVQQALSLGMQIRGGASQAESHHWTDWMKAKHERACQAIAAIAGATGESEA